MNFKILGTGYTSTALFVFRYAQTTESRYLRLLENMRYYFIGYLLCTFVFGSSFALSLGSHMSFTEEARIAFREDAKITELIQNEPIVFAINVSVFVWRANFSLNVF
jgi:hypothetical protein